MSIEVEVEFADLRTDASNWQSASGQLKSLAQGAGSRDLPDSAFMMAGYSFAQIYRRYLTTVSKHLSEGAAQSEALSRLLGDAVQIYGEAEESIKEEVRALLAEIDGN
ncbi:MULTISPECIES: hypothetical protein [unclassified Leucobacter]|uniref:hypothetical protein n=1 Tax=unclassified Leucobacter TaxID=2621730 RepID=UPI00165EB2B7|nr:MULTISPECIES: hypothetical protein [unclassified Leucobacter]MBC9936570.1 hypothetical protein [Leucobacter sp. cx-87]